jgi:diadenosine tetraphosphatase ApaH/serine/threonine PP2A family protein phosphatase
MRFAILADIHSNMAAFEAVLNDAKGRGGFDKIWCLGDMVGYGPDPNGCIKLLREYEHVCIAGNHDWAAIGNMDTFEFNPVAAEAAHWTERELTAENKDYLLGLPLILNENGFTLAHGSPREPIWEYLLSTQAAQENFDYFETPYCLVGHSHIPLIFELEGEEAVYKELGETVVKLPENHMILNPGGVGQPRDGDPKASYAIYDAETRTVSHYRVEYDIQATQRKMAEAGLPEPLIRRLSFGR